MTIDLEIGEVMSTCISFSINSLPNIERNRLKLYGIKPEVRFSVGRSYNHIQIHYG